MVQLSSQPTNINYLSPLGFRFTIRKLPNVNYFCQKAVIPGITMGVSEYPTPLINIPIFGNKMQYDPFVLSFKVDEDLKNYIEVYNWIVGLGHPITTDQTKDLSAAAEVPSLRQGALASYVSDGSLMILTSHKNPNVMVSFKDMFPISLSQLSFDSTDVDINHLEAMVSFRYLRYDIETII